MRLKWCHLVPARYSLMYLAATSVRGLRFQGNGHPKKDAKWLYRASFTRRNHRLNHPSGVIHDHRLVANAGLILPTTLACHLGLPQLVQQRLDLGNAPGRANTGDKIVTLVASALAGGDCIDDADVLRNRRDSLHPGAARSRPHRPWGRSCAASGGPCPPTGPGEPRAAGPGLGCWEHAQHIPSSLAFCRSFRCWSRADC